MPKCAAPGCPQYARTKTCMGGPGLCSRHETHMRRFGSYELPEDPESGGRTRTPVMAEFADTGCDLSPSCLRCHLPVCRYDMTPYELLAVGIRSYAR